MTTLDGKNAKRGFFTIYKPGQGKWVRWGTVAGLAIVAAAGAAWLGHSQPQIAGMGVLVQASVASGWMLLWAILTFWLVNTPKLAEFLIMTESEMRKVTWPSRKEVVNSTKVIIILTLLLGLLLYGVDVGFMDLFIWMGVH